MQQFLKDLLKPTIIWFGFLVVSALEIHQVAVLKQPMDSWYYTAVVGWIAWELRGKVNGA